MNDSKLSGNLHWIVDPMVFPASEDGDEFSRPDIHKIQTPYRFGCSLLYPHCQLRELLIWGFRCAVIRNFLVVSLLMGEHTKRRNGYRSLRPPSWPALHASSWLLLRLDFDKGLPWRVCGIFMSEVFKARNRTLPLTGYVSFGPL